jgi:hypothetical protein
MFTAPGIAATSLTGGALTTETTTGTLITAMTAGTGITGQVTTALTGTEEMITALTGTTETDARTNGMITAVTITVEMITVTTAGLNVHRKMTAVGAVMITALTLPAMITEAVAAAGHNKQFPSIIYYTLKASVIDRGLFLALFIYFRELLTRLWL